MSFPLMHLLGLTIAQAAALLTPTHSQKLCDPVTIQHLECLHSGLNFYNPFDASVFAMACLAFWSQAHLGELIFNNSFDPSLHMTRSGVMFSKTSSNHAYSKCWHLQTKIKLNGDW